MLLFKKPPEPPDFAARTSTAAHEIAAIVSTGKNPKSEDFKDVWGEYKDHFAAAQHYKCAFCESNVLNVSDGDVEHFRPKARVEELLEDPNTWGKQKPNSASLTERKTPTIAERGYHWLAYAWDNYVFSCGICNQKFKRGVFPVRPLPRFLPPIPDIYEEPLLLNCYGPICPSQHLKFNEDGSLEPLNESAHGRETIRTCGLDRHTLRGARSEKAIRAYDIVDRLGKCDTADGKWNEIIHDLKRLGAENTVFAGMVRTIIEQCCGISWDDLISMK